MAKHSKENADFALSKIIDIDKKLSEISDNSEILNNKSLIDSLYSHYLTINIHHGITDHSLLTRLPNFGKVLLPIFHEISEEYRKKGCKTKIQITRSINSQNLQTKQKKEKVDYKKFRSELENVMRKKFIYKSYNEYKKRVYSLTEENVAKNRKKILDIHLRGKQYHLDHKFSIYAGWKSKILPELLAHVYNLEIVPAKYNTDIKNKNCSLSLKKLIFYNFEFCNRLIKNTNRVTLV